MAKDYILSDTGDLQIEDGTFKMGESSAQELVLTMKANPGDFKKQPLFGAGLVEKVKGSGVGDLAKRQMRDSLALDGKDYNDVKKLIKVEID